MHTIDLSAKQRFDPQRYVTQLLHDHADARVVLFTLEPGQVVTAHTSPSTVILSVIQGHGTFSGANGEVTLGPGSLVIYAPDEPHGITAGSERLAFLAVIAPRPA